MFPSASLLGIPTAVFRLHADSERTDIRWPQTDLMVSFGGRKLRDICQQRIRVSCCDTNRIGIHEYTKELTGVVRVRNAE